VGSTYPLSAVYSDAGQTTYWAFNHNDSPTTVKFSDNVLLPVPAESYANKIGPARNLKKAALPQKLKK
jgi:hypothetical protein